jgi:hypothetical protein
LGIALLAGVTVALVLAGCQADIQATGRAGVGPTGHGCVRLQRVHALGDAIDAEPLSLIVSTLLTGGTHAATAAATVVTTLFDLSLAIDTTGDTGLASEGCGVTVLDRFITGIGRRTLATAATAAIITAQLGRPFLGDTAGLAGNTLEGQFIATLTFEALATAGTAIAGDATLLAVTGTLVFDTDVPLTAVVTGRTHATDVLTRTLVPATLFVGEELRRHEALRRARRHAHATLTEPLTRALPTGAATAVVAAFFSHAVGDAVDLFDTDKAQEFRAGRLFRRTGAASATTVIGPTLFEVTILEARRFARRAAPVGVNAGKTGPANAADTAAPIITALLAETTGFAVGFAFAIRLITHRPWVTEPAFATAAIRTALLAGALGLTGTGGAHTIDARHILCAIAT